jgi:anaerobic dimethyl sulfoxide reductase subunit C (anchor subunit)
MPKVTDLSLICFTLLTQSAVGLVFAGTIGQWLEETVQADMALRTPVMALGLTAMGLVAALTHLARLQRAPHALRNPADSWLSREVFLVPMFALALALTIAAHGLGNSTTLVILECTALCLGSAALWAMTGVYLIKTVPVWNTRATILEFIGSALLLGGALSITVSSLGSAFGWGPAFMVAATGMCLGLLLKLSAIRPGIAAEHLACVRLWYPPPAMVMSAAQSRVMRLVLNGLGIALVIAGAAKDFQLELFTGLFILFAAEVAGRLRFYRLYGRIGL